MLKKQQLFLVLGLASILCVAAEPQPEHAGRLKPNLVPGERMLGVELLPATPEERSGVPAQLKTDDRVFVLETALNQNKRMKLALVEPAGGDPYLFADTNMNGAFEESERFSFAPPNDKRLLPYPEIILNVQAETGSFAVYPVRVLLPEARIYTRNPRGENGRTLLRSLDSFVQGTFEIGAKSVLAMYSLNPDSGEVHPESGRLGMDCNGDGWIDQHDKSEEYTSANDETVIFHVSGHDVSTISIDLKAGTFIVREHAPGDNNRIPLRAGDTLPDFAFTDIEGNSRHLSEFRGKYVLLDFWATWCSPCVAELPKLEAAWQRFRSRDFVVLGIDDDEDIASPRKLLAEKGATYPQAVGSSALELVEKRFRVTAFPTPTLVDATGKLISVDQTSLRDEHLEATLDKLLPASR